MKAASYIARLTVLALIASAMVSSCADSRDGWTKEETALIGAGGQTMRVLTNDIPDDDAVLRQKSLDMTPEMVGSDLYRTLAGKMLTTVTSPEQDGVGIAGPQVGVLRRVVAVMRYDKPDKPFEVFPNIKITAFNGETQPGPEGCLSVPGRRGMVARWQDIDISYISPRTLKDTTENVKGYTAVIFQHECDHLDGILYIDKLESEE